MGAQDYAQREKNDANNNGQLIRHRLQDKPATVHGNGPREIIARIILHRDVDAVDTTPSYETPA